MKKVPRVLLTLVALGVAAVHMFVPSVIVDTITLILLVLAAVPWFLHYIRELEVPGVVKITLKDTKAVTDKLAAGVSGKGVDVRVVVPPGEVTVEGHPPTVDVAPTHEDSFESLRQISKADPNLAMVVFRIEVEKRLRRIAVAAGESSSQRSLQTIVRTLVDRKILQPNAGSGLMELIALGNRAAHGVEVTPDAAAWMLEIGPTILLQLDALPPLAQSPGTVSGA